MDLKLQDRLASSRDRLSSFKGRTSMKYSAFCQHMKDQGVWEYCKNADTLQDMSVAEAAKFIGGLSGIVVSVWGLVTAIKMASLAWMVTGSFLTMILNFVWFSFLGTMLAIGAAFALGMAVFGTWYVCSRSYVVCKESYYALSGKPRVNADGSVDAQFTPDPDNPEQGSMDLGAAGATA